MKNVFNVIIQHVLREGNALTDYLTYLAFIFVGTTPFYSFSELPTAARKILDLNKIHTPNLRIRTAKKRAPD